MSKHAKLVVGLAAVALAVGAGRLAVAQQPSQDVVGEIANNTGYFVDGKTFKIAKGTAKSDDAAAQFAKLQKMGAKEAGPGVTASYPQPVIRSPAATFFGRQPPDPQEAVAFRAAADLSPLLASVRRPCDIVSRASQRGDRSDIERLASPMSPANSHRVLYRHSLLDTSRCVAYASRLLGHGC